MSGSQPLGYLGIERLEEMVGGCLIVPMAISGSADILEAHFPKIKPVHVIVEYGKPIDPKSLDKDTRKKIGAHCQNVIADMLEKNNPQI